MADDPSAARPIPAAGGSTFASRRAAVRDEQDRLEDLLQVLVGSVDRASADQQFRTVLFSMQGFARFSLINGLFVKVQAPFATNVRGRKQWERLNRTVRSDAKPIWIVAPSSPQSPFPGVGVQVFDVSQTDGPPLPSLDITYGGDVGCVASLTKAAKRLGIELEERRSLGGTATGVTMGQALGGKVLIRSDLAPHERARVLAHEYAHDLLHFRPEQRGKRGELPGDPALRETEADATAFLVLGEVGIEYNCPTYILWMGGSSAMLMRSFKRICAAARAILAAMDMRTLTSPMPRLTQRGEASMWTFAPTSVLDRLLGKRRKRRRSGRA